MKTEPSFYDVIVVGSGPSGGRIALDLTQEGYSVLLLEAGEYYKAKDFPLSEFKSSSKLFWGGGIELSSDAQMGFLRARCVGGTSVVNQALLDRFDDLAWQDWQEKSGLTLDLQKIEQAYTTVENDISIQKIEKKDFNKNSQMFIEAFDKNSLGWSPLRRGQKDCALEKGQDCIVCLGGCHRGSKQSTLETFITAALSKGLKLISNCQVQRFKASDSEITVYAQNSEYKARKLVLAAGSFGTSQILLQSEMASQYPQLGKKLTCHPQFMSYAYCDQDIDAYKGAFQAVKSDDKRLRAEGIKFENVFAPPIGTAMLFDSYGREHQKFMSQYKKLSSMEIAIRDDAHGALEVKNKKLVVHKKLTPNDLDKKSRGLQYVRDLYKSIGIKKVYQSEQTFGLHLMGGCALSESTARGVVNADFKMHKHKNVYIADSSVFPSAPGINPSLTIMALSHCAAQNIKNDLVKDFFI